MKIMLRAILCLNLLGSIATSIFANERDLIVFVVSLLVSFGVFLGLWKGINYVSKHPESESSGRKPTIIRWVMVSYFSITYAQLGVIIAFIFRFFIDRAIVYREGFLFLIANTFEENYVSIVSVLGLVLAIPFLYLLAKAVGFAKPIVPTVLLTVLWLTFLLVSPQLF